MTETTTTGAGSRFLTAQWRQLAMLNFEVDSEPLRPLVPRGTELDTWRGRQLVSVVGFRFLDTRLLGIPVPFHRDFDEVNLRFYVRRQHAGESRRGVVFVREIVPRRAIAWLARTAYNENYVALPMRSEVALPEPGHPHGRVRYGWWQGDRELFLQAEFAGDAKLPESDSEEQFVTEHYWGYAAQRDGGTVEYRVEHPAWRVWRATHSELGAGVGEFYGPQWARYLAGPPSSAFVAEGSAVVVRRGSRLAAG